MYSSMRTHAVLEQGGVTAKLVDHEAMDHRRVLRVDDELRPRQARDHAAPVDIADEHHGHVRCPRKAHVRNIAAPEVHFRCGPRALDDDEIGFPR